MTASNWDGSSDPIGISKVINDREYFRVMTDKNQTNRIRGDTVLEVN